MLVESPQAIWGWVLRGLGGVIKMAESLKSSGCVPTERQRVMLEFQLARLSLVWSEDDDENPHSPANDVRSIAELERVKNWSPEEVLE